MSLLCVEAPLPSDAVEVGRVQDAWGVQGWIKVLPYAADPQAMLASRCWYLQPPAPQPGVQQSSCALKGTVILRIKEIRERSEGIVACSDALGDRLAAQALKGARIFIPRANFPVLQKDEFYWVDLVGLEVLNREGERLGVVQQLHSSAAQTVLVVALQEEQNAAARQPRTTMIPFVSAYIDEVDQAGKVIRVDWQAHYL